MTKDMLSVLAGEDILRAILAPDLSHTGAEPYILIKTHSPVVDAKNYILLKIFAEDFTVKCEH